MTSSVYGIALSGLNVARSGLTTTSNNIANANTPGYNRQETVVGTRSSNNVSGQFIGQGVDVENVRRVYSDFINSQVKQATADSGFFEAKFTQIKRLDGIIADDTSGMATAMSGFFAAAQVLSTTPADLPARQNFLSAAETLSARFNSVNSVMDDIRTETNLRVGDTVNSINSISDQIAQLNRKIVSVGNQASGSGLPNDLLDRRDELIRSLNEQIEVTEVDISDGSVNLFLANGQPVVVGENTFEVQVQLDPNDNQNLLVGTTILNGGTPTLVTFEAGTLSGGALSGLLEFREGQLAEYQNTLGLFAAQIGITANELQNRGVDLADIDAGNPNTPGDPLFGFRGSSDFSNIADNLTSISRVTANTNNSSAATVTLNNADFSRLSAQDFEIQIDGGGVAQYRVLDSGDAFVNLPTPTATDIANGFTGAYKIPDTDAAGSPLVSFDIGGGVLPGEGFTIMPTRDAAKNIFVDMSTPNQVAAAVRLGENTSLDASAPVLKTRAAEQGDNDGALLFGGLENEKLLFRGGGANGVSVVNAFNQLVSKVGNTTREFEIASEARESVLTQAKETRDSFSGVNMDEEAAQLIKFQQAYQASGRVISLSKEMFELVLGIFR